MLQEFSIDEAKKFFEEFAGNGKYAEKRVKKYLTEDLFLELANKKTKSFESTIMSCIRGSDYLLNDDVGLLAADAECYDDFESIFESVVKDLNELDEMGKQPDFDWGDAKALVNPDLDGKFIASMQLSCRRSLAGLPFVISMTAEDFEESLKKVSGSFLEIKDPCRNF